MDSRIMEGRETFQQTKPARGGSVLVVDYHPDILALTRAVLSRSAYEVMLARSVPEALHVLETHPHVDLVLSEVLMPGISGTELVGRVKRERPSTAVMLMTGYTDEALDQSVPVVDKPFTAGTLIDRVNAVLARSRHLCGALASAQTTLAGAQANRESLMDDLCGIRDSVQANLRASQMKRAQRSLERWCATKWRNPVILLVDGDPAARRLMSAYLSEHSVTVVEASSGEEAYRLLQERDGAVDVLVAGGGLPGMEEMGLARRVKEQWRTVPFIMLAKQGEDAPQLRTAFLEDVFAAVVQALMPEQSGTQS